MNYVVRRLLQLIPVAVLSSIAVFLLMHLIPGDPALIYAGPDATPTQVAAIRHSLGLDQSLLIQYVKWAGQVLHGNLGQSYFSHFPVTTLIAQALPATLELVLSAMILAIVLGIPLGILSASKQRRVADNVISGISSAMLGIPPFWIGILAILIFSVVFRWLPPSGYAGPFSNFSAAWKFLVLPATTLASSVMAQVIVFVRASLLDVLGADYIRTARTKGLKEHTVLVKHALRNALIPVITLVSVRFTQLLGGAVIIEAVFSWPGVGSLIVRAIDGRDYLVVQGVLLVFVGMSLLVNLLTDLSYGLVDPRVKLGRGRSS